MKRFTVISAFILSLLAAGFAGAQGLVSQPLKWAVEAVETEAGVYEITATGTFSDYGWHIYDLKEYPSGPNGTVFTVTGPDIEPVGEPVVASTVDVAYDDKIKARAASHRSKVNNAIFP